MTVISSKDIASCPMMIMAPRHWIPVHRIEECHPDLRARAKEKLQDIRFRRKLASDALDAEYQEFLDQLRKETK